MRFWKYGIAALMIGALRGVDCFVTTTTTTKGVNFMPETCLWSKTRLYGMRVTIRIVGRKGSEKWIEDGCNMYIQRLKPANIELNTEWHKSNDNLVKGVQADWSKNIPVVMLDPKGKRLSSESFSSDIYRLLEKGGSRLVYVIGGAEGLPDELRSDSQSKLISLSDMTLTHQFARLMLIEQIYRASEIVSDDSVVP